MLEKGLEIGFFEGYLNPPSPPYQLGSSPETWVTQRT